jgi:peptide/nickel transport system substrate-binding protein
VLRDAAKAWVILLVAFAIADPEPAALAGPAHRDPYPLPADTLHVRMAEVGTHGGRFVVSEPSSPRTFNALMANESSSLDATNRMFSALAGFDHVTQREVPALAKSWETSTDGLTWTFHLRRGARFSDGQPITSADVLFSFEVCYDPALHPSMQEGLMVRGKRMELSAPDSYTVAVRLPELYASTLLAISNVSIMPKHVLERPFREGRFAAAYNTGTTPESLVTSGPFRLKQYVPNEKLVLSPNPYWYGVDPRGQRLPYLDELVFLIVSDLNAASLQFESKNLDAVESVNPLDYARLAENQRKGDYTLYDLGPLLSVTYLHFNLNRVREAKPGKQVGEPYVGSAKYGWFNSAEFRRAVSHALDRDAMIRAYGGEGVKNWSVATVADKVWYTPGVTGDDYDPAESRRLLAGLGLRDHDGDGVLEDDRGNPVSFTLKTVPDLVPVCVFIKNDLAKVGIRCIPSGADLNTLVGNLRNDFQYEAMLLGSNPGVPPDPSMNLNFYMSSGMTHSWNVRQPHPETRAEAEIDSLMVVNVSTNDMALRQRTWSEVQKIFNRECFVIWLPTVRCRVPIRNGFGNLEPTVIPSRILWNVDRIYVKHAGYSQTDPGRRGARGPP